MHKKGQTKNVFLFFNADCHERGQYIKAFHRREKEGAGLWWDVGREKRKVRWTYLEERDIGTERENKMDIGRGKLDGDT